MTRDNWLCQLCLKRGELQAATICDHITPISQGGTDSPDNLQALCKRCSGEKTQAESMGKAYVPKGCAPDGTPAAGWG